jgi:adenosylcobinamide amidohydrolase
MNVMQWQILESNDLFELRRAGRFLTAELKRPHAVLSTSVRNGGRSDALRYLVNHQSCEGAAHGERQQLISSLGQDGYHDAVCAEMEIDASLVALMGTAANMNYASLCQRDAGGIPVTAVVTAGVQGNATCAGDPASFRESDSGWERVANSGTINTMLFVGHPLTESALAHAVVTMTEAKSAALQRLAVRSIYSQEFATGTSTDQYCVAAPLAGGKPRVSTGTGILLGEVISLAVREATLEALRWQNGLEPSMTRSLFSALKCYGVTEASLLEALPALLDERGLELLRHNFNSVIYEPAVAAAAYAMATVLDRLRLGTLPQSAAHEVLRQQAAVMASSLAAKPEQLSEFYAALEKVDCEEPARLVFAALAEGWAAKWR